MWRSRHTRGPADLTPGPTWPLQHPCSCPHPMKEPLAPLRLMGSWHCPHPPLLPLTPLILPWFSFPQVPGVHTFSRPWGRWRPWGTVRSPLVSRPRSILRHQGHLEPASARPSFSTVMNTVLTLRCTPSASLHRPPRPAPLALPAGNKAAHRVPGFLHPHTWVRPGASVAEARDRAL